MFQGDIRPTNILLDENFDIKLADIQGVLVSSDGNVILDGQARESSMYFMPRERDYLEPRTDLFAFGSTIHFIMTGQVVFPDLVPTEHLDFEEDDRRDEEIHRRFVDGEFPQTSHMCTMVVQRCWRGEYTSADEPLRDLKLLEAQTLDQP